MATKKPGKGGTKAKGNVEVGERFQRLLPCPINAAAVQKKKDRNFDIDGEIEDVKLEMEPFKEKIRKLQEEKLKNRKSVETSTEERMVNCVEERDYAHREIRVVRIDTRETVESKTMTDADRSPELPNVPTGAKRPGVKLSALKGGKGEPAETVPSAGGSTLTPAAAIAQARASGDAPKAEDKTGDDQGDTTAEE